MRIACAQALLIALCGRAPPSAASHQDAQMSTANASRRELPLALEREDCTLGEEVTAIINETIPVRRWYVSGINPTFASNQNSATSSEISLFVSSNPLFDASTRALILDPSIANMRSREVFQLKRDRLRFRSQAMGWSRHTAWYLGTRITTSFDGRLIDTKNALIWKNGEGEPIWLTLPNRSFSLARALVDNGAPLTELSPRQFEELIGELLEREGWEVRMGRGSKDDGIDVEATRNDRNLGIIRSIWQAKRYGDGSKVALSHVKELSATLESYRATKGVIVTTSKLTRGAISWVRRDQYRLSFLAGEDVRDWISRFD
jgi:restriction system protein